MRTKPFQVSSQRLSYIFSFGSKREGIKGGEEEKEETSPFLYSKPPFLLSPLGGGEITISGSEGKEGRIFKISPLYAHRAHVENSLVTSFEVTSFRISAHLTCSRGQKSL